MKSFCLILSLLFISLTAYSGDKQVDAIIRVHSKEVNKIRIDAIKQVEKINKAAISYFKREMAKCMQKGDLEGANRIKKKIELIETKMSAESEVAPIFIGAIEGFDAGSTAEVLVLRYVREYSERYLYYSNKNVPHELKYKINSGKVTISGRAKFDTKSIKGQDCGHFGKLILLPKGSRRGTFLIKVAAKDDGTKYDMMVKRSKQSAIFHPLEHLKVGVTYKWNVVIQGDEAVIKINNDTILKVPAKDFDGLAFGTSVRRPGDTSYLEVTF